jgi:putative component of membrane protein insertase Oxa1/YidC/SpoIIIJ protein YidD
MKPFILPLLLLFLLQPAMAQDKSRDLQLIEDLIVPEPAQPKQSFILGKYKGPLKLNPANLAFSGLMLIYRKVLSPQLAAGCLYEPSCANFSMQAINEFGLIKGLCLSADRLCRCTPLAAYRLERVAGRLPDPAGRYKMKAR